MIDTYAELVLSYTRTLERSLTGEFGFLDKIDGRIADGEWSHPDALASRWLTTSETVLRSLADAIKERREQLIGNMPVAAE